MQRRWKVVGVVVVIVVVAAIGIGLQIIGSRVTTVSSVGVSSVPCSDPCLRFPTVSGENLPGQTFNLPDDFKAKYNLVIVPFDENEQVDAQTWLPFAKQMALEHPDFAYYNVPVFPNMAAPLRTIVRGGMSVSINDDRLEALTITVFLDDRDQFLAALKLLNADAMRAYLLNASGEILWQGSGEFTDAQGKAINAVLTSS